MPAGAAPPRRAPPRRRRGRRAARSSGRGDRATRRGARRGRGAAAARRARRRQSSRHRGREGSRRRARALPGPPRRPRTRRRRAAPRSRSGGVDTARRGSARRGAAPRRPPCRLSTRLVDIPRRPRACGCRVGGGSRTSSRLRSTASRTVAAPAFGLPSRSPPIQLPNRSGCPGRRRCHSSTRSERGVPQALLEEPQPLADLVDDPRSRRAHLVGLPEDRDLLGQRLLDPGTLPGRESRVVEVGEKLPIRRCFSSTVRGNASVGWAVSTSSTDTPAAASASSSAPTPGALELRRAPRRATRAACHPSRSISRRRRSR